MLGQLSIFDFLEAESKAFNPLEELALCGTGFVDGMKRVRDYFMQNHTIAEKAKFLKQEYGIGGFSKNAKKPCYLYAMNTFGHKKKDVVFSYYDENMTEIESSCTWEQLAKTITDMMSKGKYNKEEK